MTPEDGTCTANDLLVCERLETVSQGQVSKWSVRTHGDGGGGGDSAGSERTQRPFSLSFSGFNHPAVFV